MSALIKLEQVSRSYALGRTGVQALRDVSVQIEPGEFVASGHEYSADLARFVREAYALTCTEEQMERIEQALRGWLGMIQAVINRQGNEDPAHTEPADRVGSSAVTSQAGERASS